jgi:hypothetical protein
MNIDEVREKIAEIINNDIWGYTNASELMVTRDIVNQILSIEIGGEVEEECPICKDFPYSDAWASNKRHSSSMRSIYCNKGKITRPRTLRDVIK